MALGDPIGADLAVGTTNANTLPESGGAAEEREITFGSSVELTSGIKYAIVVRALDAINFDSVYWIEGSNDYADGRAKYSTNSGSTWANDGTADMWFKTKASGVEKDTNTPAGTGTGFDIYNVKWNAQTFTPASTYTITSVVLKLYRWVGSSPGTLTVSIKAASAVGSKATTPAPANAATDVTLDQATISWVDGGTSDTFDVYYGNTSGDLTKVSAAQAGLSYTVTGITLGSPYDYIITRYWRIDSTNDAGTVTGDEWSFTTIRLKPPIPPIWNPDGPWWWIPYVPYTYPPDNPPAGGDEDVTWEKVTYGPNFIKTTRKLVAIAENRVWIEDV